ncbi:MAG: hypothetical protein KGI90_14020 [Burkholderiales bacterium]|nr:hypothetical protein [Burkholderiales bacterium]MDE2276232.1 hypothetical protein [Burkholderiales bacterium]
MAVPYVDMPRAEYQATLEAARLPPMFANVLADSDAGAAMGALFDDQRQLSQLIGRPTTSLAAMIKAALR